MKLGRIAVVGRGKVGAALVAALRRSEANVTSVRGRTLRSLSADTVILAVPDAALAHVALTLADPSALKRHDLRRPPVVLHVSGLRDSRVLDPLREAGLAVAAAHPLVSFAERRSPPELAGTALVASGDAAALEVCALLARRLNMTLLKRSARAPLQGAAYHAAAAMLANGSVALAAEASAVLAGLGVPKRAREAALAGLLSSVAHNLGAAGLPDALTGPIARGDAAAVAFHLRALPPRQRRAYEQVSRWILPVAIDAGLPPAPARAIAAALDGLGAGAPPGRRGRSRRRP